MMLARNLEALLADTEEARRLNYQLRHPVFCQEPGFEDPSNYPDEQEKDEFDGQSVHFLVQETISREWIVAASLILPTGSQLPIQRYYSIANANPPFPLDQTAEFSGLLMTKSYRQRRKNRKHLFEHGLNERGDRRIPASGERRGTLEPLRSKPAQGKETDVTDEALVRQLDSELLATKEDLRGTIEELEASNDELTTSKEEVMSMNEELQSLNEDLTTLNNQLQDEADQLALAHDALVHLLSSTEIATLLLDAQFRIKGFTPATCKLFNLMFSDVGRSIGDISHRLRHLTLPQDAETVLDKLTPVQTEVYTESGQCYIQRILPYRTADNTIEGVVATFIDITERKQAEESLQNAKNRLQLFFESTGEALYCVDMEGCCTFVNARLSEQLGYAANELLGKRAHDLVNHTRADGSAYPWEKCLVYRCLEQGARHQSDDDVAWRKDGTSFPTLCTAEPIVEDERITGAVVIFRDMTEAHAQSSHLNYLARHDSLTELLNRREFEHRLERVLESARRDKTEHALCYLDLDQFKVINDTCGHLAGDELLRQIAGVLRDYVRKRDTIARLGGDEFGLLMEHCDMQEAGRVANTIRDAIADYRFLWEDKAHAIGVSIGVVSINEGAGMLTDVLKAADAACYTAKESGRDRIHVYHEQGRALATRHGDLQWVARINRALEENRLYLTLQPIAPIHGVEGENISYEVLVRMEDDDGNIIHPATFLGAAERYNLSIKLDRWVISTFFGWLVSNTEHLECASRYTINLFGQSLGDEKFLDFTIAELKKYRVPPENICFEITETAAISNLARANRFMHALKQSGCSFALDDFGTGLSAFGCLRTLPVEYLKISGIVVKNILNNPVDLAMVKSIHDIGQVMGKKTIAKYVESEDILGTLRELGINYAQGYAIGKPERLDEVTFTKEEVQPKGNYRTTG